MAVNINQAPTFQAEQAKKALISFYQKPIAQVSTELFFTIGAVVFFALFAIRPTVITMTELVKEIEDKEKLNDALARKVTALASVSTEYFSLQDRLYLVDEIIPETAHSEKALRMVEKVASNNSLVITTLQLKAIPPAETTPLSFNQKQPVSLAISTSVEGEYANIRAFLEEIGTLRPLFTVTNIHFTQAQLEEGNTSLMATFTVQAHYYGAGTDIEDNAGPTGASEEVAL